MNASKKRNIIIQHSILHIVLLISCMLFLLPIAYTFSVSLRTSNTFMATSFELIPKEATMQNYYTILFEKPFFVWLKNSVLLSSWTVIFALTVSVPAAYAYSRFKFKARNMTLYALLLLNAFPSILSMVAIYRLFRTFGLLNTYLGLIVVYTGGMIIFGIWNMKGYFDSIPISIEEAAMIDGAGYIRILWSILLPLARPAIIVTAVLIFITTWNEYIYAVNFLTDRNLFTLAAGLYSLQGTEYVRNWPVFAAGALIISLPVLIVFFAIQKYMVSGLTVGGVKY